MRAESAEWEAKSRQRCQTIFPRSALERRHHLWLPTSLVPSRSCSQSRFLPVFAMRSETNHSPWLTMYVSSHRSMVLLDDVVEVLALSQPHSARHCASRFRVLIAAGQAGFLSTGMTRGIGLQGERNNFRKNRFAAAASRLAASRKSMVCRWSLRLDRDTYPAPSP